MIIETNWGNFRAKFNGREQVAFEWLCSLLFYKEHDRPTGALRYFNQPGIEAEPVIVGAEVIGWQAKFIDTELAKYKTKLIEAIDTAKAQHPTLTQLYFYMNVDFGRSKKQGIKDPAYKTEVEGHARKKGIVITWKTASFFETPFVCEANANIASHFFRLTPSVIDFVQEIARHSMAVLEPIRSNILIDRNTIKINRQPVAARLKQGLSNSQLVIVSGDGGVGKTAVIKDFYDEVKKRLPFFVFKATEFNVTNINQLFKEYGDFTFSDFVREHDDFIEKYVIVDSAEKLSDLDRPEIFQEFLSTLRSSKWKILFTTRLSYLEDLKYAFIEIYNAPFEPINIEGLTQQELVQLSQQYSFTLPQSERLCSILRNPFYLNEYLRTYPKGSGTASYREFREAIWKSQIARSSYRKDSIHRRREECFLEIARKRAASGRFFVNIEGYDQAIQQLELDEIIKFDSNARGYFITHDIYEEWAFERIIEQAFHAVSNHSEFYEEIGDSLAIRRAFRDWLSGKLAVNDVEVSRLIESTVGDDSALKHWKDEAIVAALLSKHSSTFIQYFEKKLLEPPSQRSDQSGPLSTIKENSSRYNLEHSLLYRVIFLVRIACKELDTNFYGLLDGIQSGQLNLSALLTQPKGSGWESLITFIDRHKNEIGLPYMHVVLPLLDEWTGHNKQGEATKAAGQIALSYYYELTKEGEFPYSSRNDVGKQLIRVILNSSGEIKTELAKIFQDVIDQKNTSRQSGCYELVKTALSSIDKSAVVAGNLPKEIIGLAEVFWPYTPPEQAHWKSYRSDDIERLFNLEPDYQEHYPASAFKTPIFRLLQVAPFETVDFILAFTNRAIEYFAKTNFAEHEVEEIDVYLTSTDEPIKQYISHRIWLMYRGGQPAPNLLESMHMALERWLLMVVAKQVSAEVFERWCHYLIKNSRSASITAVVASAVLAEPSKLFNIAQILFRTKEFFSFDLARLQFDKSAKNLYSICHDPLGLFMNERIQTCDDQHRKWSLENLALNYQTFRSEAEDEELANQRQQAVWAVLDEHYSRLSSELDEEDKIWRLCLARMDRRKMTISSEVKDNQILITFNPEIDPELREYSENSLAETNERMRFMPLNMWANYRWEEKSTEYVKYPQYENDLKKVVNDTRAVYDSLITETGGDDSFRLFYRSVPPTACAVLLRDFEDRIDSQDKEFCRDVLIEFSSFPLQGNYDYQIGDGIDTAINALPFLLPLFPAYHDIVMTILLFTLFDRNSAGINNRFSDHAVSAIINRVWKTNPKEANALFLGYLKLQPKYELLYKKIIKEFRAAQVHRSIHSEVFQRFMTEYDSELTRVLHHSVTYEELLPISLVDTHALVSAFLLIPIGTSNQDHKNFAITVVSSVVGKAGRRNKRNRDEGIDYGLYQRFLEKFAYFVLGSDRQDIPAYIEPFISDFMEADHAEQIFQEFISAEDRLRSYDSFWLVWELFYPYITKICKADTHSTSVIHYYLLAWPYWRKGAKDWDSLKEREKNFFARVAMDMGGHPAALYSLAKFLNEVGARFATDGVFWISDILENHSTPASKDLEINTVYYLENFIRRYVIQNREKVRSTTRLRTAVLTILNFLLEQGSVTAYLTREYIL